VDAHGLDADAAQAVRTVAAAVEESWYGGVDPQRGALDGPVGTALQGLDATPLRLRRRLLPPSLADDRQARRTDADDEAAAAR
jgi:hypothetical protein